MKNFLAILMLLSFVACSGSNDTAHVRFMNASVDSSALDALIDSLILDTNLGYSEAGQYIDVDEGSRTIRFIETGTGEGVLEFTTQLSDGDDYTILAANMRADIEPIILLDDNAKPDREEFHLRVVHAAPTFGSLDIYITRENEDLVGATPAFRSLSFAGSSDYSGRKAREYQIRVTRTAASPVIFDSGGVSFDEGEVQTLVLLDSTGGGRPLVGVLLLDKEG